MLGNTVSFRPSSSSLQPTKHQPLAVPQHFPVAPTHPHPFHLESISYEASSPWSPVVLHFPGSSPLPLLLTTPRMVENFKADCSFMPGPSPGGSRVIRRWGRSRRLWKYTYLIPDIKRLEMDCVVGRLLEKKRLNNLDYVE